ncbi:hypothetical protein [Sphaerisporangium corydalis]|uniref:Uncharacterized protein n=1 Tax=Sphaerisporangium corydalis TaxID=1441875 RepID=A0ABV9EAC7_9ACTN|nr:hypothetical protein [Sphaerisporangium corydalis]
MRQLRRVIARVLCITAMLAAGLTAVAGSAQAAVPKVWGFAFVNVTAGVPDLNHQAGTWGVGPTVQVTPGAVGEVVVKFPNIGIPGGVVHVTAVTQTSQWCQVEKWWQAGVDELVAVRCYKYGGAASFTPFSIVFEQSSETLPPPQAFGYIAFDGASITSQYNSAAAVNTVTLTSPGVWTVLLPGLGSIGQSGNIQVTSVNSSVAARCKVGAWAPSSGLQAIQVRCHNATSVPFTTGWNLTYHRERAITGGAIPPKNFAYTFDNTPAVVGPYTPVPAAITYNSVSSFNDIQSAGIGLRLVRFHKVGVLQDDVQVTAFGPGPEYCNLLSIWGTLGNEVVVRDIACYNAMTTVNVPSMSTYVSAF